MARRQSRSSVGRGLPGLEVGGLVFCVCRGAMQSICWCLRLSANRPQACLLVTRRGGVVTPAHSRDAERRKGVPTQSVGTRGGARVGTRGMALAPTLRVGVSPATLRVALPKCPWTRHPPGVTWRVKRPAGVVRMERWHHRMPSFRLAFPCGRPPALQARRAGLPGWAYHPASPPGERSMPEGCV